MKIRVITPITSKGFCHPQEFLAKLRPDTELSHIELDRGPASIECAFDEMLAVPEVVARAIEAEREGVDALMINCMGDPGLHAVREVVSIPVVGPCEASMHAASMLGHTFSVITIAKRLKGQFENQAKIYGVREKLASVRSVEIPVLDLEIDRDRTVHVLVEQAVIAVEQDEADAIIFGCTGMTGTAEAVEEGLRARGIDGVPVIDPPVWALKLAEAMADMGLRHSKRSWPAPPEKRVDGFEFIPRLGAVAAR